MPEKEYRVLYLDRKAYIKGYLDHNKEILVPHKKDFHDGYRVITPLYYYLKNVPDKIFKYSDKDGTEEDMVKFERAAIVVDRGWIPAELKDRRLRPHDFNSINEVLLFGTIRLRPQDKDSHQFYKPNNPTYGVWNNFCLEDFAFYWNLPNIEDAKYCYFKEIDFGDITLTPKNDVFPIKEKPHETIIESQMDSYNVNLTRNYGVLKKIFGALGGLTFYLYALAA